jgi:hypothetical protein
MRRLRRLAYRGDNRERCESRNNSGWCDPRSRLALRDQGARRDVGGLMPFTLTLLRSRAPWKSVARTVSRTCTPNVAFRKEDRSTERHIGRWRRAFVDVPGSAASEQQICCSA